VGAEGKRHYSELAGVIGHRFGDDAYLIRALTHASFDNRRDKAVTADNERLEFLGDRVLGLIIAELLFTTYPASDEGDMARRLNQLVRKETCAEVAREIDLGAYLRMGSGEIRAGGRDKMAVLGNACEALIAAVYLDGGLDAARTFIERFWRRHLEAVAQAPLDAKTALQEWAQGRGLDRPAYSVTGRSGPDHAPVFTVAVAVEGYAPATGSGNSKRQAEQDAAASFFSQTGLSIEDV